MVEMSVIVQCSLFGMFGMNGARNISIIEPFTALIDSNKPNSNKEIPVPSL